MKNEKQVVHDAISFYKGFLEAVRWCQSEYGINLNNRIEDAECLIEQYKFRLMFLLLDFNCGYLTFINT